MNRNFCLHVRFYNNQIQFFHRNLDLNQCVYCKSESREKIKFTLVCDFLNQTNIDNQVILNFLEKKLIPFKIIDYENLNGRENNLIMKLIYSQTEFAFPYLVDDSLKIYSVENFMENYLEIIRNQCEVCGKIRNLYEIDICFYCKSIKNQKKIKYYNFVTKLDLKTNLDDELEEQHFKLLEKRKKEKDNDNQNNNHANIIKPETIAEKETVNSNFEIQDKIEVNNFSIHDYDNDFENENQVVFNSEEINDNSNFSFSKPINY